MKRQTSQYAPLSGLIMLVGIIALIVIPGLHFWPWILVVVALASFPYGVESGGPVGGLLSSGWLILLAIIIALHWWMGIFFLILAAIVIGTFIRRSLR